MDDAERTAQKKLDVLKPLIEKFRTQQAASYETLEEIMLVLGGGITRAAQYTRLEETFSTLWKGRYGNVAYRFDRMKDRPQLLRLLKMMPIDEIEARMGRYIKSRDPFFQQCKHTFPIFVKTINQHALEQPTGDFNLNADEQPATGCHHTPPCTSDAQHTATVNIERRREFNGSPF